MGSRPLSHRYLRTAARRAIGSLRWPGSQQFWERHYASGGNSGSGSFGPLAQFKAETINRFVVERDVHSVIEFGCGDGNQLAIARYPEYLGLDVASAAVEQCMKRFSNDETKSFIRYDPLRWRPGTWVSADLALSLDVIFHLVEDDTYARYMRHLFDAARRWVIIYASNTEDLHPEPYARHHRFTDWVAENAECWKLIERIDNLYPYDPAAPNETSWSDFWIFERIKATAL